MSDSEYNNGSFIQQIVKSTPSKYDTIIESNILAKKIKMKISEYNSLENEYNDLIKKEKADGKKSTGGWEKINWNNEILSNGILNASGKLLLSLPFSGYDNYILYGCTKPCNRHDTQWRDFSAPEPLQDISMYKDRVWATSKKNNIYKGSLIKNEKYLEIKWQKIPGKLNIISIAGGWVWGVNSKFKIFKCKQPCNGDWILDSSPETNDSGPKSMIQISCGDTYVYGVDNNNKLWRKNIDGTGTWSVIDNIFAKWVTATNSRNVYIVNNNNQIQKSKHSNIKNWKSISPDNLQISIKSISADHDSDDIYILPEQHSNRSDTEVPGAFLYKPEKNGGYWLDIKNENYFKNLISVPGLSNTNFKFLGKTDTLQGCKIKSVEDKNSEFSSITYVTDESTSGFKKSCYGNYVNGKDNPTSEKGFITSLAPNGTTVLGGEEGKRLLKAMKDIQDEIKKMVEKQKDYSIGLEKTNDMLIELREERNKKLNNYIEKLRLDRIEINKVLDEPQDIGMEIKSQENQISDYFHYILWIILVIISIGLAAHLLINDKEKISVFTYVFAGVWILILGNWYAEQIMYYSGKAWHTFANTIIV